MLQTLTNNVPLRQLNLFKVTKYINQTTKDQLIHKNTFLTLIIAINPLQFFSTAILLCRLKRYEVYLDETNKPFLNCQIKCQ